MANALSRVENSENEAEKKDEHNETFDPIETRPVVSHSEHAQRTTECV
jgi:hypothetical protein